MPKYVNVKIPIELAAVIDRITKVRLKGYRNRGEFVSDAVREKLNNFEEELKEPRFKHVNVYDDHATIWDNLQKNLFDVYFKETTAWCEKDDSTSCDHVEFALSLSEVIEAYKKKGVKVPEMGDNFG